MRSPKLQLGAAVLIFLVSVIAYFFWYSAVAADSKNASELENSIQAANSANQQAQAALSAESGLSESEATVNQYFLTDAGVVPFLENLQSFGSAIGATVTVESVGTGQTNEQIVVALDITGTFDQVVRTVGAIEYAPYDLVENSLTIENDAKNAWHADMTITVGAEDASTSTPASVPPAATTVPPPSSGSPSTAPL